MRHSLLFITLLLANAFAFGQCAAPQMSSWHFSDSANVDIAFYADDNNVEYQLVFTALYQASNIQDISVTDTVVGISNIGINSINYNVVELLSEIIIVMTPSENGLSIDEYYYKVELFGVCNDGELSEANTFYVSPFSLLNDTGFSLESELLTPIQYLSFESGGFVDIQIEIPEEQSVTEVEGIGVFVDVAYDRLGDLSVTLTSPSGTVLTLLPFPNYLYGARSMSFYFTDEGSELYTDSYGHVAPPESLSIFNGEIASGTWTLRFTDHLETDSGNIFGVALDVNSSPCEASISGSTFYDFDANGIENGNDQPYQYALIDNTATQSSFFSNISGVFFDCVEIGAGELSVINPPLYYESQPTNLPYYVLDGNYMTGFDFAMTPIGDVTDLKIDMVSYSPDRPGFENDYIVQYSNLGTTCIDDVYIEVEVDPILTLLDVNATDFSISENTIIVNVGMLCPLETGTFTIYHYLNSDVPLGTILSTSANIFPMAGDETGFDNFYRLISEVVGSFDPNDKQVNAEIINDSFLENTGELKYLVRFQNTGTYLAENVVVKDTLDENLDMSTFQLINTSHEMDVSVEGRVLQFNFSDIMLPDSTSDFEGSNGFLRYSIAPYSDLDDGTLIENTAYIYFDFNEPIITNTTQTLVDFASGLQEFQYEGFLYPNPAKRTITVTWPANVVVEGLRIFDIAGKEVLNSSISKTVSATILDVSHLGVGNYVIQFLGNDHIKPVRWVKL